MSDSHVIGFGRVVNRLPPVLHHEHSQNIQERLYGLDYSRQMLGQLADFIVECGPQSFAFQLRLHFTRVCLVCAVNTGAQLIPCSSQQTRISQTKSPHMHAYAYFCPLVCCAAQFFTLASGSGKPFVCLSFRLEDGLIFRTCQGQLFLHFPDGNQAPHLD